MERNVLVTLNVMSARAVSPHEAIAWPWRMITPLAAARSCAGPSTVLWGASFLKVLAMSSARFFVFGFSLAIAKATASSSLALSKPASAGSRACHSPRGGK